MYYIPPRCLTGPSKGQGNQRSSGSRGSCRRPSDPWDGKPSGKVSSELGTNFGAAQRPASKNVGVDLGSPTSSRPAKRQGSPVFRLLHGSLQSVVSHNTLADASSHGLGAVLLQVQPEGRERAVAFESRSLTPTETGIRSSGKRSIGFDLGDRAVLRLFAGSNSNISKRSSTFAGALGKVDTGCAQYVRSVCSWQGHRDA